MTAAIVVAAIVAISPNPSQFGAPLTVAVQGAGTPSFAPFEVRAHHGDTYVLQCLSPACVPGPNARVVTIAGARLTILPRTTKREVATPLRSFERQTTLPPPSYTIQPDLLKALLLAAAAVLVATGAVALWPLARRLVPERSDDRTPLERALALVRSSRGRDAEDRRRALDLLGRALGRGRAASEAFDLAWSEPSPDVPRIERLLESVER